MERIEITESEYENLVGLLSFANDATEEFTPSEFDSVPKPLRPIFTIRPFKTKEREDFTRMVTNINSLLPSIRDYSDKMAEFNSKLCKLASKAILNVRNFIAMEIGVDEEGERVQKSYIREFEKEDGHITSQDFEDLSELVKKSLLTRLQTISGFNRSEKASL